MFILLFFQILWYFELIHINDLGKDRMALSNE